MFAKVLRVLPTCTAPESQSKRPRQLPIVYAAKRFGSQGSVLFCPIQSAMSIYIFKVGDSGFFKLGFTRGCPWKRIASGVWSNVHPEACCNKLGFENLNLLALYKGTLEQEQALQALNPYPENGEFWPDWLRETILDALKRQHEMQMIPEKPDLRTQAGVSRRSEAKRVCCTGGQDFKCFFCDKVFRRFHHLLQHQFSAHSSNGRTTCQNCGTTGLTRNILHKRHTNSAKCRVGSFQVR